MQNYNHNAERPRQEITKQGSFCTGNETHDTEENRETANAISLINQDVISHGVWFMAGNASSAQWN
jgi:hypothetical protein